MSFVAIRGIKRESCHVLPDLNPDWFAPGQTNRAHQNQASVLLRPSCPFLLPPLVSSIMGG